MEGNRWWRGLLARVTLIYAFGALALSAIMALATFALAQNRLLSEAESAHRQQMYQNALDVRQQLLAQTTILQAGLDARDQASDDQEARLAEEQAAAEEAEEAEAAALEENSVDADEVAADLADDSNDPRTVDDSIGSEPIEGEGLGATPNSSSSADGGDEEEQEAETEPVIELTEAEEAVAAADSAYNQVLTGLRLSTGSAAVLLLPDGTDRSLSLQRADIPSDLQARLSGDDASLPVAELRYDNNGTTTYAVGTYFPQLEIRYFEVLELTDLEATLGSLRVILAGVAAVASIAGAALGFYSARGALSPLPRISNAARSIASGDFNTKLDLENDDRDLAVLAEAFNGMVDAVSDRIDREQRFTSDVSHELRSPLMTLTASVEVLERRKESLPDVAQQAIDLLSHDLRRFQRLVEDLLEVSRMEAGAVQIQLSRFGLREFLENVIFQSKSPHLELIYSEEDAQTSITADKRRLAQVMTNLVENADKYGGGADGVRFEVVGPNVQIVVADNGPGVPADQRERIFERFGRVEAGNRASAPGFGLGLSLVAEHVRLHGGQVWVTDRIDGKRGARFVVQLPVGEHIDVMEEMAL